MKKGIFVFVITLILGITVRQLWPPADTLGTDPRYVDGSSRLAELLSDRGIEAYAQAAEPRNPPMTLLRTRPGKKRHHSTKITN